MILDVTLAGHSFAIALDGSDWHDDHSYSNGSDPAALLEVFERQLAACDEPDRWLNLLAAAPTPVVIWRRVLSAAARNRALVDALGPFDELVRALAVNQLAPALAALVRSEFPSADETTRAKVEAFVLGLLPEGEPEDAAPYRTRELNLRLLHALDRSIVSDAAGAAIDAAPKPYDPTRFGGPPDFDRYEGLDLSAAGDSRVADLVEAIESFVSAHLNTAPNAEQLDERLVDINELEGLVANGYSGVLAERAADLLVRVAATWARCAPEVAGDLHTRARARLLEAATATRPEASHEEDVDDEAEGGLFVIKPGPRIDAAMGLTTFARLGEHADDELLDAVETLAQDSVRSVRHEVVRRTPSLGATAPEVAWRILRDRAENETAQHVLRQVVFAAWNLRSEMTAALDVFEIVASRSPGGHGRHSATAACVEVAALLWTLHGIDRANSIVSGSLDLDVLDADAISSVLHNLRKHGCFTDDDGQVRRRTLEICSRLAQQGAARIKDLQDDLPASEDEVTRVREGVGLLDAVTTQLYFAAGVHDASRENDRPPTAAELRLVDEAGPLFDVLAQVPIARVAHHLVEIQAFTLDSRPSEALRSVATVVAGGTRGTGYALESQAVDLLVSVVSILLADHRSLFDDEENLTALRTVLEVFIEEGTPDAHQLIYGIGQIFR